jgi:hypothetical protein
MSMARKAFAAVAAAALTVAPVGVAHADNTNDNSNTNNNSDTGGYLDTGSGADESKNWPPTKLDWPPSDISAGGISSGSGGKGEGGQSDSGKATPIVMPSGQAAAPKGDAAAGDASSSTSTTPTPIVPVSPAG